MGPFGSGKSSGCVIELVKLAKRQHLVNGKRRARIACIRNTYKQLEDTTIKTFCIGCLMVSSAAMPRRIKSIT